MGAHWRGRQTGRAAFSDFFNRSHWGGIISGDEITIDWDTPCPCGLASVPIEHDIIRYSEKEGVEDDRITCAATQQVNDAAIDFIKANKFYTEWDEEFQSWVMDEDRVLDELEILNESH